MSDDMAEMRPWEHALLLVAVVALVCVAGIVAVGRAWELVRGAR